MKLIKKEDLIKDIAKTFKRQYYTNKKWAYIVKNSREISSEKVYKELLHAKTKNNIDKAIGNDTWTQNKCNECSQDVDILVEFYQGDIQGDCEEYDLFNYRLCLDCLLKGIGIIQKNKIKDLKTNLISL